MKKKKNFSDITKKKSIGEENFIFKIKLNLFYI